MQKVSKQSLAMIALSILLAISIALTFTFAGLSANKTAKGTITFSGNLAITMGADFVKNSETDTYEFTLAESNGTVTLGNDLTIGVSGVNAYVKIVVGAPTGTNASAVTIGKATAFSSLYEQKDASLNTFTSIAKIKAGSNVKLSDLIAITLNLDNLADDTNVTFTITITADVDQSKL